MSQVALRATSRFLFAAGIALIVIAGWLWWKDRRAESAAVLHVEQPVDIGAIPPISNHPVEVAVTNTGSIPIRIVGLDGAC